MTAKTDTAPQEAAESLGIKVTDAELAKARKDGALEAAKEAGKNAYKYATDGNLPGGDWVGDRWPNRSDIMQFADLLDLDADAFAAAVADGDDAQVPEEKAAGLLELERSGRNRTPYVQALVKRLKVKSPYEVTSAGPGYTNDVRPISKL